MNTLTRSVRPWPVAFLGVALLFALLGTGVCIKAVDAALMVWAGTWQ